MAIIRQTDKRTGITYVFESISTYYPELKQSRSKRHIIGKIDPISGEVVPCGKPGRPKKVPQPAPEMTAERGKDGKLQAQLLEAVTKNQKYETQIRNQQAEITRLSVEVDRLKQRISNAVHQLSGASSP